jgi:hypothetical protein
MKKNNKTLDWKSTDINDSLTKLDILIGDWDISGNHPLIANPVTGKVNFKWFNGKSFLVIRTDFNKSGPPDSTAVIGSDDSSEKLSMLYFDERGVSRIYEIKFHDNIWEMWRTFPGFSQRFTDIIKDNGNKIEGTWEISQDDKKWNKDLEITYRRNKE